MPTPGRDPRATPEDVLDVFAARTDPTEPLTAPEIADEIGVSRRTAYEKLRTLRERGAVASKKTGGRSRVWWIPAVGDGRESDSGGGPRTVETTQPDGTSTAGEDRDAVPGEDADTPDEGGSGDGPAFPFDETTMHGLYVRDPTWDRIVTARSSVTAACAALGLPAFEGREFHDACLAVAAGHGDEIALRVLQERGIDADGDRVQEILETLTRCSEATTNIEKS